VITRDRPGWADYFPRETFRPSGWAIRGRSAFDFYPTAGKLGAITDADLKRLMEDGKSLYAFDKVQRVEMKGPTDYFLSAVNGVRENKQRFAEAEAQALLRPKTPTPRGAYYAMQHFASVAESDA
jgi:hypothetical protein